MRIIFGYMLFLPFLARPADAAQGWWMTEPIRWVQTNLRETDAALDPVRHAGQLADMRANVVLMGMGGICAYYPTRVEFHYPSPYLPPGRDMFGDFLREAHARHIRVVGRYDLSKTPKPVYDAHPEWFFRKADGSPVIYNGLYSTCINGGYYRGQAMKILAEGLERYDVDGLFFNMFGNQSTDYDGNPVGLCHCNSCRDRYRRLSGRDIPDNACDYNTRNDNTRNDSTRNGNAWDDNACHYTGCSRRNSGQQRHAGRGRECGWNRWGHGRRGTRCARTKCL